MNYKYYPGCSLHSTGKPYEVSMHALFDVLGIQLEELDDWNCCGATAYMSIDEIQAFTLAARNLCLAEMQNKNGDEPKLLAPCAACYLVLSKTQHYLDKYPEVNKKVRASLQEVGYNYNGRVSVKHPLEILINDYGIENIAKKVKKSLKGIKVACYYGCQIVRPFEGFDDQMYPVSLDRIMESLGATTIDWRLKTRCCGGSLTGTLPEAGVRLSRALLKEAKRLKADVIVTACPLCQFNLECYQDLILKKYGDDVNIPVLYFSQLMGLALGVAEDKLALQNNFIEPHFKLQPVKGGEEINV